MVVGLSVRLCQYLHLLHDLLWCMSFPWCFFSFLWPKLLTLHLSQFGGAGHKSHHGSLAPPQDAIPIPRGLDGDILKSAKHTEQLAVMPHEYNIDLRRSGR